MSVTLMNFPAELNKPEARMLGREIELLIYLAEQEQVFIVLLLLKLS